ncbi:MAG: RpiB/LacA/LacB family sugar-phosphate isomerase [Patescibacteria group bacterium]|nr:RpiB/LacA/LacB family sugar-phosphate isomerase [Patescibacteria group bacterium]
MKKNLKAKSVYLGADHNGFRLKELLKNYLSERNYLVRDLGNLKFDPQDDYPDYGKKVARAVAKDKGSLGILLCGSGQGMMITANKFTGIRATFGYTQSAAKLSRHDNDSNVLCLPAWQLKSSQVLRIVNTFLKTEFSQIERHKRRIKKMKA